jgi:hypothetical protein
MSRSVSLRHGVFSRASSPGVTFKHNYQKFVSQGVDRTTGLLSAVDSDGKVWQFQAKPRSNRPIPDDYRLLQGGRL